MSYSALLVVALGVGASHAAAQNPGLRDPSRPFGITKGMSPATIIALPSAGYKNVWTVFGQTDPRPNLDIVLVTATESEGACAVDARSGGEHFWGQMRSLWRLWSDLTLAYGQPAEDPFSGLSSQDVPTLLRSTPHRLGTVWRRPESRLPADLDSVLLYPAVGERSLWDVRAIFYFDNYATCLNTLGQAHVRW